MAEVREYVRALPKGTWIISGGAPGVDEVAVTAAKLAGMPKPHVFEANWKRHGKQAGHIRNDQIIAFLVENGGGLTAFWDGKSSGTSSIITKAIKAGVLYEVREPK